MRLYLAIVAASLTLAQAARADEPAPAAAPPAAAPTGTPAAPAAAPAPSTSWMEEHDALYKVRGEDAAGLSKLMKIIDDAIARNPKDFEAWWRKAQLLCWQANGQADGSDLKAAYGKACMNAGEKAATLKPDDARGHYWCGVGIGVYSEGVGILTALTEGLEGKFRDQVQTAMKLDEGYNDGGARQLWGRFFFKLPWPKRDVDESIKQLTQANKEHPNNLRTRLFLADSLDKDGKGDQAKALIKSIEEFTPRDAEDKRVIELGKKWLKDHE
ncbi:MAG: tetratricopeptide repeat protein [Deltaproteobacteria bacterium]|nr:tetratricopeptide repeat protein [Deltaproteobacteria bacterium]